MKYPSCLTCRLFYKDYSKKLETIHIYHHPKYNRWLTDICALQHLSDAPLQYPFTIREDYEAAQLDSFVKIMNPESYFCAEHMDENDFQFFKDKK